jgi:hypothetical protein
MENDNTICSNSENYSERSFADNAGEKVCDTINVQSSILEISNQGSV